MKISSSRWGRQTGALGLGAAILLVAATASAWQDMGAGDVAVGPTKNAKLQDGANALDAGKARSNGRRHCPISVPDTSCSRSSTRHSSIAMRRSS